MQSRVLRWNRRKPWCSFTHRSSRAGSRLNRMDDVSDDPRWCEFADGEFRLRFRYPSITPQRHRVNRVDDKRGDARRVHLTAPDSQELYIEVIRFRYCTAREEYGRHRIQLEERFGVDSTTPLTETSVGGRLAWTYAFRWSEGERSVLLIPLEGDTYRVIYDPRSPLNRQVISTIRVEE